jgi:hypothetical protein
LIGHVIRGDEIAPPANLRVVWTGMDPSAPLASPAGEVPCFVEGRLIVEDGAAEGIDLAIAINGTIEAMGKTRLRAKPATASRIASAAFSVPVPVGAFRPGPNDVRVFVPRRDGGTIRLLPTRADHGGP